MKKLFLLAAVAVSSITATAQTEDNDYLPDGIATVEWRFNPFDYEAKPKNMAQLNARMFLDAKNALRLSVGFGYSRDKDDDTKTKDSRQLDPQNYDVENSTTTTINKETTLKVGVGYEYHFASAGRLDLYAGAEAGYLGRFYSATVETSANSTHVATYGTSSGAATTSITTSTEYDNLEYTKSNADRTKFNENGIYATVFTGIDFYVYKKLYIGAELGITFNTAKKANGTYTESQGKVTTSGPTQTANWTYNYSSETGIALQVDNLNRTYTRTAGYVQETTGNTMKVYIEPAIRIGWMF